MKAAVSGRRHLVVGFDPLAAAYDAQFSDKPVATIQRAAVWRYLDAAFAPGDRVLELGCGTGRDAVHLAGRGVSVVATDASQAMLEVAERQVAEAGAADMVALARLDMAAMGSPDWRDNLGAPERFAAAGPFDGAFSDFGALNCVEDLGPVAAGLGDVVRPGGRAVLVVLGPLCLWELGWHLGHAEPRVAGRRFRGGAWASLGEGAATRVWYPSPRTLAAVMRPWFRLRRLGAIGLALPPFGLAEVAERRPRLLRALAAAERVVAPHAASAWLADHYVAVFERR